MNSIFLRWFVDLYQNQIALDGADEAPVSGNILIRITNSRRLTLGTKRPLYMRNRVSHSERQEGNRVWSGQ